ncbi:hypothetical protein KJ743_03865, partial [Patescibacteria group bacterium]|nr:hypothetical protein [Patescibacteria group bacterium]
DKFKKLAVQKKPQYSEAQVRGNEWLAAGLEAAAMFFVFFKKIVVLAEKFYFYAAGREKKFNFRLIDDVARLKVAPPLFAANKGFLAPQADYFIDFGFFKLVREWVEFLLNAPGIFES